ncbi:hypothetical protein Tco_0502726 [Tanacetum coccineum]
MGIVLQVQHRDQVDLEFNLLRRRKSRQIFWKDLWEIPYGLGIRDDTQSRLVSTTVSISLDLQHFIPIGDTYDLLITDNHGVISQQPIHADNDVKTSKFYAH